MRHLNYPGDVTNCVGQVMGPDLFKGMWQAVSAEYDAGANRTRVAFKPYYVKDGAA